MKDLNNKNNCGQFEILLDEYIDGEISASDKEALEQHISTCSSCKKDLEETLNVLKTVSSLPKEMTAEPNIWNNVEQRISPEAKPHTKRSFNIFNLYPKTKPKNAASERHTYGGRIVKYAVITLAAAMLLVILLPSLFREGGHQSTGFTYPFWPVIQIKGLTTINSHLVTGKDSIKLGDWIETKDSGKAMLEIPGVGSVILEPNTKVKIVKTDTGEQRIALEYGTINANINTTPRTFIVDSKSAEAIDLGCAYTFTVDTGGNGIIYVKSGMVELNHENRKSLVPAGKFCITKSGIGPGTPYRENTSPELKDALLKYDFGKGGDASVKIILKHATEGDAVTLLNLLPKVDEANRPRVYERVSRFVPPPKEYNYQADSLPEIDFKELHEWIDKINKEVNEELRIHVKELQQELKEDIQKNLDENLGNLNEKLQKEIQENVQKHMEALKDLPERIEIPNELMEQEMKKMQEKMSKIDTAKLNRDMEKLGRDMEKMGRYWEQQGREWEREWRDQEREQEMDQRQQELEQRQQERQQELEQRQQERQMELQQRMDELQQRQQQRQQELDQRQRERDERLQQQEKEREKKLNKENQNRENDTDNNNKEKSDDGNQ